MPSRLNVQLGDEAQWDLKAKKWRDDLADVIVRIRKSLERLSNDSDDEDGSEGGDQ